MFRKLTFILVFIFLFFTNMFAQIVAHKPDELQKIVKYSKIKYIPAELYLDIDLKDNSGLLNENNIYHEDSDGKMIPKKLVLAKEAELEWTLAEKSFNELNNLKEARKHYKGVLEVQPEYYPAKIKIGQTYEKEADLEKAEINYKGAISKNFVDYLPHYLIAEAYFKEKNFEDAINEIVLAHILDRNNPKILEAMIEILVESKLNYIDWNYIPQIKMFKGQKENEMKVLSKPGWEGYAMGKAIWNYEPGYAASQGEKPGTPSFIQEKECIMNQIDGLDDAKIKNNKDVGIENLLKAKENKMLDGFIYYEALLPQAPSMIYLLPNNVIKAIKNYVLMAHAGVKVKK